MSVDGYRDRYTPAPATAEPADDPGRDRCLAGGPERGGKLWACGVALRRGEGTRGAHTRRAQAGAVGTFAWGPARTAGPLPERRSARVAVRVGATRQARTRVARPGAADTRPALQSVACGRADAAGGDRRAGGRRGCGACTRAVFGGVPARVDDARGCGQVPRYRARLSPDHR